MAFTQNTIPTFPKQPTNGHAQIVNADGVTLKTVYTAGANGSKIIGVLASSSDPTARDVMLSIVSSAVTYTLGTTTVPITAGQIAATPATNLMAASVIPGMPVDNDGNPFLFLVSGETLVVGLVTGAVTAAKAISVTAIAEDF